MINMEISQIKVVLNKTPVGESSPKYSKPLLQTKETQQIEKEPIGEIVGRQKESVKELAENLTKFMQSINYNLQFIPDREEGTVIIKVLDKDGNLIRQIPPEAFLALSSKIGEHIGILINSKL